MQIWFCQACGARVTKADLGNVPGLTASTLVYCKDCLKKENRSERVQRAAKPERPGSGGGRPPSKAVRRKSTRNVSRVLQPEREEAAERDDGDEPDLRRNARARHSASTLPRAGSKTLRLAAMAGALLLITGIILVNVDLSPTPARVAAPPHASIPEKPKPELPVKPAIDEKASSEAYAKLEKEINALPSEAKQQKLQLIDAYVKSWNDSIAAARARTLRERIASAPDPTAPTPVAGGSGSRDVQLPPSSLGPKPPPSPILLMESQALNYAQSGDFKNAALEYDRALNVEPKNPDLLLGRAEVYRNLHDYENCLAYTDQVLDLSPKSWPALALQSISAYALSKDTLYKVDLEKALKLCDRDVEYKRTLKLWIEESAVRGRTVVQGRQLERREPKYASEFAVRGNYRWISARLSEAEADLRHAIELDPAAQGESCFKTLTLIFDERHDAKAKLELCKEWVKRFPRSSVGYNNLAWELLMSEDESLRDPKAGLALAQRAYELKQNDSAVLDTLALAYFYNNDVRKAVELERKAIEAIPEDMPQSYRDPYTQHLTQFEFVKPPDP
jgi:tetratricopeptide (TPR) repeat protein